MHLAKHPGQKVAAITLSIAAREGASGDAPGDYRAKLTALMRDKPDTYSNPGGSRCVASGETLSCFTDGFFLGKFSLEHAGKNMKLAISGADEHVALMPGIDLSSFVVLSPENPEHTLFLLKSRSGEDLHEVSMAAVVNAGERRCRAHNALAAILMVSASRATLYTKETRPWAATICRMLLDVTQTSDTCDVMPMTKEK